MVSVAIGADGLVNLLATLIVLPNTVNLRMGERSLGTVGGAPV